MRKHKLGAASVFLGT
ncbi:YSIRK-type signal peptide-containing protein, partial [Staphylococcus aureus]